MVIVTANVSGWEVTKIMVDIGSYTDMIFAPSFDELKIDRKFLQPVEVPLVGFWDKRVQALGKIAFPVSFGSTSNPRTEYVTFDVVDMHYPYNVILGWGFFTSAMWQNRPI